MFKHEFKDSGITAEFRRISFTTLQMVRAHWGKQNPAPEPPLKEFDDGAGGKFTEKDTTDKAYQASLAEWVKRSAKAMELGTRQTYAELALLSEPDAVAVNQLLQTFDYLESDLRGEFEAAGLTFKSTNLLKYVYLWNVCITTTEDYTDFVTVMTQRSQPTSAVVTAAVDTFSSQV